MVTYYGNMGEVYLDLKNYFKAISVYQKALGICQEIFPATHLHFPVCYAKLAEAYKCLGDFLNALIFYEKEVNVLNQISPNPFFHIALSYHNIIKMHMSLQTFSKALPAARKLLEAIDKHSMPDKIMLVNYYNDVAVLYYLTKDLSQAIRFSEKAIEIGQTIIPLPLEKLGTSHTLLGRIYKSVGDGSRALASFQRAVAVLKQALPANHMKIKAVEDTIQSLIKQN